MTARLSPQAALWGHERPLPALPACVQLPSMVMGRAVDAIAGVAVAPGRSADGSWSEACYAVRGASSGQVQAWGRAHGQHAVFRLSDDVHEVVSCWHAGTLASRARVLGRWGSSLIDTSPIRDIMSCQSEPTTDQSARMRALRFSISICALPWCTSTGGT